MICGKQRVERGDVVQTRNAWTSATATRATRISVNIGRRRRRRVVAPSVAGAAAVTDVTLVRGRRRSVDLEAPGPQCEPVPHALRGPRDAPVRRPGPRGPGSR